MNEELLEAVVSADRQRDGRGRIQTSPGWHDLEPDERQAAYEATVQQRALEAALDPQGHTATVKALLARLR